MIARSPSIGLGFPTHASTATPSSPLATELVGPGTTYAGVALALAVAALFTSSRLVAVAERMPYGPGRDMAVQVAQAWDGATRAWHLDQPSAWVRGWSDLSSGVWPDGAVTAAVDPRQPDSSGARSDVSTTRLDRLVAFHDSGALPLPLVGSLGLGVPSNSPLPVLGEGPGGEGRLNRADLLLKPQDNVAGSLVRRGNQADHPHLGAPSPSPRRSRFTWAATRSPSRWG